MKNLQISTKEEDRRITEFTVWAISQLTDGGWFQRRNRSGFLTGEWGVSLPEWQSAESVRPPNKKGRPDGSPL